MPASNGTIAMSFNKLEDALRQDHDTSLCGVGAAARRPATAGLKRPSSLSFHAHNIIFADSKPGPAPTSWQAMRLPFSDSKLHPPTLRGPALSLLEPLAERRFPHVVTQSEELKDEHVPGLVGLQNLGNTCFMNTCVQCLLAVDRFNDFFIQNHHMYRLSKKSKMKGTLALSFGELLHKLWGGKAFSSVAPSMLKERISKFAKRYTGTRQHDAQEFLRSLLDGVHRDLRTEVGRDPEEVAQMRNFAHIRPCARGGFSSVVGAFGGEMASSIICMKCGHASHCREAFLDLSLPIPSGARVRDSDGTDAADLIACSLHECFQAFTAPELLDGENRYFCENCKRRRPAVKQLLLTHCPEVLVVHIKRFSFTPSTSRREKLVTNVFFPGEGLDLTPFVAPRTPPPAPYDLKAVALHSGRIGGGHYRAVTLRGDAWYEFDDSSVRPTRLERIDGAQPYILFYQRRSPDSPAGSQKA